MMSFAYLSVASATFLANTFLKSAKLDIGVCVDTRELTAVAVDKSNFTSLVFTDRDTESCISPTPSKPSPVLLLLPENIQAIMTAATATQPIAANRVCFFLLLMHSLHTKPFGF